MIEAIYRKKTYGPDWMLFIDTFTSVSIASVHLAYRSVRIESYVARFL